MKLSRDYNFYVLETANKAFVEVAELTRFNDSEEVIRIQLFEGVLFYTSSVGHVLQLRAAVPGKNVSLYCTPKNSDQSYSYVVGLSRFVEDPELIAKFIDFLITGNEPKGENV